MAEIPHVESDRVLATWSGGEDAALWTIDERRLGVLTVDFITPVSDDPYVWGQIAAANSISDVFAMGGRPIVALNIVGFPSKVLGLEVLKKVLEGGFERTRASGAFLVGGHSVQDEEPKYGLVVYGEVDRDAIWRTVGGRPGDRLLLTKPVGTGVAVTAIKAGMVENPRTAEEAMRWMTTLNDLPLRLSGTLHRSIHAGTDVTGFGLVGHILDMLSESTVDCELSLSQVPILGGVPELADMGLVPEGAYRNREAYEKQVDISETFSPTLASLDMIYDAQTSGGLLLAVAPDQANSLLRFCRENGFERSALIGTLTEGTGRIRVVP